MINYNAVMISLLETARCNEPPKGLANSLLSAYSDVLEYVTDDELSGMCQLVLAGNLAAAKDFVVDRLGEVARANLTAPAYQVERSSVNKLVTALGKLTQFMIMLENIRKDTTMEV